MSNPSVEPGLVFRPSVTSDVDGGLFGYIPLIELHRRTTAFADATGIAPMDLVRSRLVNMPIPFYPADWETGMRRWQGVDAAAMWHPLMWLPAAVATRYVIDGHVEDDDSWAVRVAYEATSRGVYDPETGRWADLTATVGIDLSRDRDQARIVSWLQGDDDTDLDRLEWPEPSTAAATDQDWAFLASQAVIDALRMSRIATDAEVLGGDLDTLRGDLAAADSPTDRAEICEAIASWFAAAEASFASVGDTELAWWAARSRRVDEELTAIRSAAAATQFTNGESIGETRRRTRQLADTYRDHADRLTASLNIDLAADVQ